MRRPVHWSRRALDDLKTQISFIARENREAALKVAEAVQEAGAALGRRAIGRPGRVTGTYEKSVSRLPYIVVYTLAEHAGHEAVVIVRVIHTARNWPRERWPE